MIENDIQKEILSLCSFLPDGGSYSQLKPKSKEIENDLFNYHLQYLVKNGYLNKADSKYTLTPTGKALVTNIDHVSKSISTNYKVSVYLMPVIDDKILLYTRLKHPQYGYKGLISGKIKFGDTILDTAKREFNEETNMSADFKVIGSLRQIRKNAQGEVIEDGIFFICYTDKVEGELIEKNIEGEYYWIQLDEVSKLEKLFKPSVEICVDEVIKRVNGQVDWENKFFYELQPEPEDY